LTGFSGHAKVKARRFEVLGIYHHFRRLDRPLAIAAMVPAVLSGAGLVTASTTAETAFSAIAVASAAYLLWRATSPLMSSASRSAVLVVLTLAAVLPEYVVDIHFAWSGAGSIGTEGAPYALSGATGANSILIGLAWPLLAIMSLRRGGRGAVLEPGRRISLWILLLASLYGFTIFLKDFLSLFDTAFLALLFGAYLWMAIKRSEPPSSVEAHASEGGRGAAAAFVWLAVVAGATVVLAAYFAGSVIESLQPYRQDRFEEAQWIVSLATKGPLIVIIVVQAWRNRAGPVMSVLLTAQIAHLTVVPGSVPVAFFVRGMIDGAAASLPLEGIQGSELLITAAQTLFLVVMAARMAVSIRGAALLLGMFALQATLGWLQSDGDSTAGLDAMAAAYLGLSVLVVARDRTRLAPLLAALPRRGRVQSGSRLADLDSKKEEEKK
jgi:cation:H+ antiporter